jgi:hypothetical protein
MSEVESGVLEGCLAELIPVKGDRDAFEKLCRQISTHRRTVRGNGKSKGTGSMTLAIDLQQYGEEHLLPVDKEERDNYGKWSGPQ